MPATPTALIALALGALSLGALGACTGNDLEGHASLHTSPRIAATGPPGLPGFPDGGASDDAFGRDDARSSDATTTAPSPDGAAGDGATKPGTDPDATAGDAFGPSDDAFGSPDAIASGDATAGGGDATGGAGDTSAGGGGDDATGGPDAAGTSDDAGGGSGGHPDASSGGDATSDAAVEEDIGPPQPPGLDPEWCRLWHPAVHDGPAGSPFMVYSHVSVPGLTDETADGPDPAPWLRGEIGYGPVGALPTTHPQLFTWVPSSPEANPPSWVFWRHDRYETALVIPVPGLYDYAARFSGDYGATWLYCDLDGSQNGFTATEAGRANLTP